MRFSVLWLPVAAALAFAAPANAAKTLGDPQGRTCLQEGHAVVCHDSGTGKFTYSGTDDKDVIGDLCNKLAKQIARAKKREDKFENAEDKAEKKKDKLVDAKDKLKDQKDVVGKEKDEKKDAKKDLKKEKHDVKGAKVGVDLANIGLAIANHKLQEAHNLPGWLGGVKVAAIKAAQIKVAVAQGLVNAAEAHLAHQKAQRKEAKES